MQREVGGGIGMGNTCKPMAVSFQCMTKSTTVKKKKKMKVLVTQSDSLQSHEPQASLYMEFSRKEYWSGLLSPFSRGSSQPRY